MPPPVDPLRGIQESALAIYDERKRLNDAFAGLQMAVAALKPGYVLNDDGVIEKTAEAGVTFPPQPTRIEPPKPSSKAEAAARDIAPPKPAEPEKIKQAPKPPQPALNNAQLDAAIVKLFEPGERKSAATISRLLGVSDERVRERCRVLKTKGRLLRDDQFQYFLPAPVRTRKEDTEQPRPTAKPASESSADTATEKSAAPEAKGRKATPSPDANGAGHGLARSPKPREQMRAPQREAEERMDGIVFYMMQHPTPEGWVGNDLAEDMGIKAEDAAAIAKFNGDLRELERRGVLVGERPGRMSRANKRRREGVTGKALMKLGGRPGVVYKVAEGVKSTPKS